MHEARIQLFCLKTEALFFLLISDAQILIQQIILGAMTGRERVKCALSNKAAACVDSKQLNSAL